MAIERCGKAWAAALLLLSGAAAQAGLIPPVQHWQTPNGVPVYLVERHELPVIDLKIDLDAGASRSPPEQPGLASLALYGLMDKDLQPYEWRSPYQLLTDSGNQYGVELRRDRASIEYRMVSTQGSPRTLVDTLARQLSEPRYPFDSFKVRRDWLAGQLSAKPEQSTVSRNLALQLFGTHPLARVDRMTPDNVKDIGNSDTRAFYRRYYVPGNVTLTFVGDLNRAQAEAMAEALTRFLPKGEAAAPLPEPTMPKAQAGEAARIVRQKNQSTIELAQLLALDRHDDDMAAVVLGNYMLGSAGFQSRLMRELREQRGLTYNVSSALDIQRNVSLLSVTLTTRNEQADAALALLREQITRFTREGPSEAEVTEARDRYLRSMNYWGNTNEALLSLVSNLGYYKLPLDYYDRFAARIAQLDAAQIKAAWQRHVDPEGFRVAIEGPAPAAKEAQ
ncbi:insulinase family protein [Chitiniphilus purpureus]|uniref:Insulinase family protein n=1 Tax=Chitiniphilus purpureus TaxID=2981137 RepID=A0ABY6DNR5_9NEIS|nr:pitrilysin family protein [Chitiniphilus sp. CD1]UXY16019.1 insulinase family protein [Chitiniphilus sp. CD1]